MKKRLNIIFTLLSLLLLVACGESYNSIYEDVVEVDPNVNPVEGENLRKVRILPTLKDPDYYIEPTKGMGPYHKFTEDREHWLNAVFKCFAFPAKSYVYSLTNALLWNKEMKLLDEQGTLAFYDVGKPKNQYYDSENPLKRYKFFAFSPDTDDDNVKYRIEGNTVTAEVELDGTQDILHSFASHTDTEYEKAVGKLPEDETTLAFLKDSTENLYNALSGNRGIHPIFRVNHILPKFDLYVRGGVDVTVSDVKEKNSYIYCVIESIEFIAPHKITMEIASDSWERDVYKQLLDDGLLVTCSDNNKEYDVDMLKNPMHGEQFNINFDDLEKQYNERVKDDGHFWVETSDAKSVANTIMLPPTSLMRLIVKYNYVTLMKDSEGRDVIDKIVPLSYEVDVEPSLTGDSRFLSNTKYNIFITVYGLKGITVQVLPLDKWIKDQEIEVGQDEIET